MSDLTEYQLKAALLQQKQSLPLHLKEDVAMRSIKAALDYADTHGLTPFLSYSGGKDSRVLMDLVHRIRPDVACVLVNTGLEYPDVVEFARKAPNFVELHPKMTFKQVLEKYGYPVVSKRVAQSIRKLRAPGSNHVRTLILTGYTSSGNYAPRFKLAEKWRFLVDAPFLISEKCCDVMKKQPLHAYAKEVVGMPFIGTLAADSAERKAAYFENGCNTFDGKDSASRPLSTWLEQDILQYIVKYSLDIAPVYGDVVRDTEDFLRMTGEDRTGCIFCLFGIMEEWRKRGTHRFQRMAKTHPQLYRYCMEQLGIAEVLKFLGLPLV